MSAIDDGRRRKRIAVVLLSILLGLALLEAGARLLDHFQEADIFVPDPVLGWRLNAHTGYLENGRPLPINAEGIYNDAVPSEKSAGEFRILCIGDSITAGLQLDGKTFPHAVEQLLAERYPRQKWRVINAGIPGYNSWQGRVLLDELAPLYRPDLIVVTFLNNEVAAHRYEGPPDETTVLAIQRILYHSALYRRILKATRRAVNVFDGLELGGRPVLRGEAYAPNLESFVARARTLEIPIVFVEEALSWPQPGQPNHAAPQMTQDEATRLQGTLHALASRLKIPLAAVDAAARKRLGNGFYRPEDTIHPSAEGNALMARALVETLEASRLLPVAASSPR